MNVCIYLYVWVFIALLYAEADAARPINFRNAKLTKCNKTSLPRHETLNSKYFYTNTHIHTQADRHWVI